MGASEVEQAMSSHLRSNGTTQAAKVDSLIPSAIFHSFLSTTPPQPNLPHEW
jgi:hypothetical protein